MCLTFTKFFGPGFTPFMMVLKKANSIHSKESSKKHFTLPFLQWHQRKYEYSCRCQNLVGYAPTYDFH